MILPKTDFDVALQMPNRKLQRRKDDLYFVSFIILRPDIKVS